MTRKDFTRKLKRRVKDFSDTDLRGVDFTSLCLDGINFKGANLSGCNFCFASLYNCNLESADLSGAKMYRTILCNVNLTNVILDNANVAFNKCTFEEIEIDKNTMDKYVQLVCPSEGEFIGWKKAFVTVVEDLSYSVIVKLLIPKDARRSSAFGRKCRCDKARVLSIECLNSLCEFDPIAAHSFADKTFVYVLGKEVSVDNFDEDRWHECAPGIHFFMTREEAVDY